MKALAIALLMLIFNAMMAGVSQADIFTGSTYYDNTILESINESNQGDIRADDEQQLQIVSGNILSVFFGALSWNWVYNYIPLELRGAMAWIVNALNLITGAFVSIAVLELFWRRDIWGSGT